MTVAPRAVAINVEQRGARAAAPRALPLVLLHGWGLNLGVWDGLGERLAADRDVLMLDLPGHGGSAFDAAAASLDCQATALLAALPSRCVLIGWSLGGQLALEIAARAPDRIERLVLVATTPRFEQGEGWACGLRPGVLGAFAERLRRDYRTTVTEFLELQVRGSRESGLVLQALRRALLQHGEALPLALEADLELLRTVDLRRRLANVAQPTIVIAGQYDRVTPPAAARSLAAALPQGCCVELRRAAHAPFLSHPEEFLAHLGSFVAHAA